MTQYPELKQIIDRAGSIVFFGGAGVSTGSGIPDFRGSDGLYTTASGLALAPEELLHHGTLTRHPEMFFEYYKKNMVYPDAKPNAAHKALARLEARKKRVAVITQNIDGLHQLAGSKNVIELHGSVHRNYCTSCGKEHTLDHVMSSDGVPRCTVCGAIVRPDVVLYGEGLDDTALSTASRLISTADVVIVGGTSLTVNPAAALISYFSGKHLIILNKTKTPYDPWAELLIREPIEEVLADVIG
ncbi:MAG: NAD-dependent protein deacylase [Clostridia bacterium]|nr:NAD-dependent protein deacylase [Clostridia bacterium]